MSASDVVLGVDIGTTSVRCIAWSKRAERRGEAAAALHTDRDVTKHTATQDPEDLLRLVVQVIKGALSGEGSPAGPIDTKTVKAVGFATQRASIVIWEKATGKPVTPLILYSDHRSKERVEQLNNSYKVAAVRRGAGALSYLIRNQIIKFASVFKFTTQVALLKLQLVVEENPKLREGIENGSLLFGTVDTWLVWKLTSGAVFATDYSNIGSTGLYDPFNFTSTRDVMSLLTGGYFPSAERLPDIRDTSGDFGVVDTKFFGFPLPIKSVVGDQQASTFGSCCFDYMDSKITLGTVGALDINTGTQAVIPTVAGVYPLIAWKIGTEVNYIVEGQIEALGNTISWLVKNKFASDYKELNVRSPKPARTEEVYFVPAFQGIMSPHTNHRARGMFIGLTANTTREQMTHAVLDSFGFGLRQLRDAIRDDTGVQAGLARVDGGFKKLPIRVDGGAAKNDVMLQSIADCFDTDIQRPRELECTSLGAAFFAGLAAGVWKDKAELRSLVSVEKTYQREMADAVVEKRYAKYVSATQRARDWLDEDLTENSESESASIEDKGK